MRPSAPKRRPEEPAPEGDAELMVRIAAGNLAALGVLYDRYFEDVREFVRMVTARAADADDLVHDLFLSLTRIAATYDGRPSARPFLIGIAAQMARRRAQRLARLHRLLAMFRESIPRWVQRTPEDIADDAEELDLVDDVLGRLSEEKRLVLLMVEREGLSGEEVAAALGIPVATVWTRLHYGRAELRRALARRRTK
jgi:RNA polymerase sigma factor (sigma-70 family)